MEEILTGVSWIGVVVGAAVAFIGGWLWYSPILFGKPWAAGNNIELGTASAMPVGAMISQAVGLLLISWFVGVTAVESHLLTFILALVGFIVLMASGSMFTKKPSNVIMIDAGYWVVAAFIMFIAQAIF